MTAVIPAILIAIAQSSTAFVIAKKRNYPSYRKTTWEEKKRATLRALPALMLPVIILGGIFGGVFSVTEASAIAAFYSGFLAFVVYKNAKVSDLPKIFANAALSSGLTLILVGAGMTMSWAITNEKLVDILTGLLVNLPKPAFLLGCNILLLIVGCFMDDGASVVIFGPILGTIAVGMGVNPLHIAVIICINLVIGLATPPFGITLFITSPLAGVKLEQTVKEALPFVAVSIAVLLLITFVPDLPLWLPRLLGYTT